MAGVRAPGWTVAPRRFRVLVVVEPFAPLVEMVRLVMSSVPVSNENVLLKSLFLF